MNYTVYSFEIKLNLELLVEFCVYPNMYIHLGRLTSVDFEPPSKLLKEAHGMLPAML